MRRLLQEMVHGPPGAPRDDDVRAGSRLMRAAPGLAQLLHYRREWLGHDLAAGASVAAVALPTAIAYAEIIGLRPVVGLYAAIPPLVAYAIFGTSRLLIANPDAAVCAMVAATLAPLAAANPDTLAPLAAALALLTGLICIGAGFLNLGFVADFLAQPILVGFLNGVALQIFVGQLGKVFGFAMESHGIIPNLLEVVRKLPLTHLPTLIVGAVALAVMVATRRFLPRWPAPLLAVLVGMGLVHGLGLETAGVAVVGEVPPGLPWPHLPIVDPHLLKALFGAAVGLALLSFTKSLVVATSFVAKPGDEVDADRELYALGACQIAAGLAGGFAVSGADSRTAMNQTMGGKSQLSGLVAAVLMTLVLLFLTGPLRYLPMAALGAVLIIAAFGLFDIHALNELRRVSRGEFALAMVTTLGVVTLGVLDGILLAVGLALLLLVARASRPPDAELGRMAGLAGYHDVAGHEDAERVPGLVLYRFGAALMFFNSPYFKRRILALVAGYPDVKWVVLDGGPINLIDTTGAATLRAVAEDLAGRGITLALANVSSSAGGILDRAGMTIVTHKSLESAVSAFRSGAA